MQFQSALIVERLLLHAPYEPARHPYISPHGQWRILHDILGQTLGLREYLFLGPYAVHNAKLKAFFRREVATCQGNLGGKTPPAPEPSRCPVLGSTDAP